MALHRAHFGNHFGFEFYFSSTFMCPPEQVIFKFPKNYQDRRPSIQRNLKEYNHCIAVSQTRSFSLSMGLGQNLNRTGSPELPASIKKKDGKDPKEEILKDDR